MYICLYALITEQCTESCYPKPTPQNTYLKDSPKLDGPDVNHQEKGEESREFPDQPKVKRVRSWSSSDSGESNSDQAYNESQLEVMDVLQRKIRSRMQWREDQMRRFLPENQLQALMCRDAVVDVLEQFSTNFATPISELADYVCEAARKIFAILIRTEEVRRIERFYKTGFKDTMLPLKYKLDYNMDDEETWTVDSLARELDCLHIVNNAFDQDWTFNSLEKFCNDQWAFLSPIFEESNFSYEIEADCRMPFLEPKEKSRNILKHSYFSDVQGWDIPSGHLRFKLPAV